MVFSVLRRLRYMYGAPPMDNFIFQLCYRWTVLLLVTFSFIVTCRLLFGDSFSCIGNREFPDKYLTTKCYDVGVYILPENFDNSQDEILNLYPSNGRSKKYQFYYSWVNLLFLVQAFNFYIPHLLWKTYESGYIYRLTAGVQKFSDKEEKRGLELCCLAKYALVTEGMHKRYMEIYLFFEACNFAISVAHIMWLVCFFDVTGIPSILPNDIKTWSDFKRLYFPSEGSCKLYKFGSSGAILSHNTPCYLPLNSLYMIMYLFLYSWYILLTALCGLVLVYRLILLVPASRIFVIKHSSPLSEKSVLETVFYRMSYSDWFFICRLQKAMTDTDFAQMIDQISLVSQGRVDLKEVNGSEDALKDFDNFNMTSSV